MNNKRILKGILVAAGMLTLILDSKAAFNAAEEGVDLCIRIVIPSLFPFLLLSIYMNKTLIGIPIPFLKNIAKAMALPEGTESILISSFLGGYPSGAQAVMQHFEGKNISKTSAEKLLAFTNNAGPSFIFGMISHMFSEKWVPWALWMIHIFSAFAVSLLLKGPSSPTIPSPVKDSSGTMEQALKIIASVCGWVILFRIIINLITRKILSNERSIFTVLLTGILELSNGCLALEHIRDFRLRFVLCCAMLSFGGLCVTMQTISVVKGLKIKYYLCGKFLQLIFSIAFGIAMVCGHWYILSILLACVLFLVHRKNKCRNNEILRV